MKKLRSLVAAVVAVACLYTPTAAADPLSVELNALDSTIQVDGMAGNQPDGDAADGDQPDGDAADGDQPDDNGVVESDGGALTSGSGEPTVESEGADTVPEGADATPGEGDGAADDGPTADTPQAVDWTNAVDNLRLSTQGLTITPSVPADGETDADIAGTSVIPEGLNGSGVSRGAALGGLAESQPEQQTKEGAAQLPDAIDATLNLTFTLDAAAGDGRTDGSGLGTIVAGDHFSVPMPEGLATADEGSALDVFARDTDGNATTVRVAEAKVSDGVLTVTFTEPADAQAREAVTASIDVPVTLDAALVQDEVSAIEWTVRTMEDAEGNRQPETLTLNVPAKSDVMKMLGLTVVEPETEDEETDDSADKQGEDAEHGTEDESAANDLTATAEPLALPETEVTYALGNMNGTPRYPYQIVWCDNNSGVRPAIDALKNGYILQYSLDDGKTFENLTDTNGGTLTADAQKDLHLSSNTVDWSKVNVEQTATNTWTLTNASGLPTNVNETTKTPVDADGDGEQDFNADGTPAWDTTTKSVYPQDIVWQIAATNATASEPTTDQGYVKGANDSTLVGEGNNAVFTRYFMLTAPVSFTIVGKLGGDSLTEIFQNTGNQDFRLSASIDNKPVEDGNGVRFGTLEELFTGKDYADYQMQLTYDEETNAATIRGNMPTYDQNGLPIVYYVHYEGPQTGQDYYQVSYDNSQSANHGSANDGVYSGGTMTLRHAGTTSFTATKDWLDGASDATHPETTFTLWRYTPTRDKNEDGYLNASQVQLAALKDATNPNPGSSQINATSYVSITVPSSNEDSADLGKLLREKYGDTALNKLKLPKYDPDGYPYVYCLREEGAPAGYEIVFGDYANGTFTDTKPSYQGTVDKDNDGELDWNYDVTGSRDRPANNPFVYNNGTISNRRTGTVPTQVTKTWEIAAFQDQLQQVQVTLQAQSRRRYQEESQWQNASGENAKQTLTGWYAESLTQTVEQTFPKYDEAGYELEYRWLETGVALGDQQTDFKLDETTGEGTFTLTLTDAEGNPEALEFTSERETDADGNVIITNSFLNETDETVIKLWKQPDGGYAQALPDASEYEAAGISTEGVDFSGEVTVGLYQDGKPVGEYTLDGETEGQPTAITELTLPEGFEERPTWQETEAYKLEFEHLPKYTEGGVRHTYLVLEEPVTGWDTDRTYDAETRTTTITNDIGPGESSDIRISKQWIDGDDASHRVDVVVQLIARHDIHSQAKDEETGKYVHEYEAGAVVPAWVPGMDGPQEEIQIGFDDRWFQEVEVPMGGLTWEDFEIREIALVDTKNTPDTADDVRTPVVNYEDAQSATEYTGQGWLTSGWDETSDTLRVATDQHVYEVTTTDENGEPAHNADLDSLEVTNRRLGLFDLTVTKHWSDSDAGPDTRPDAQISVSSPEYPNAFRMTDGKVYVSISRNVLPVVDKDGNQLTDANAKVEGGVLTVSIDKSNTDSEYTFFGLPKYDANGTMVHYEVEESWVGSRGEYSFSSEVGAYNIGPQHYHDSQTVKLDNTRGATRPVTFHKIWNDRYVNDELNQRPDIYLTLYRVTRTVDDGGNEKFSQPEAVDGYIRWLWQGEGTDESGGTDASYNQMATIEGLAKYDAEGNEYVYYATEDMAADGDALDYVDVRFDYSTIKSAQQQAEVKIGGADAINIDQATAGNNPEENGVGWAIHEDGTFINTVQSELIAKGTKLWENVPGITSQGDLPEITIYLQQRLAGSSSWPEMKNPHKDEATGEWVFDQGTIAQTSHITMTTNTNNQYTYTLAHEGINGADPETEEGAVLQRYDDEGNRYEYRAIEVVWGLLDQPGGFTESDIKDVDFATEESKLLGDIYTVQHGETGSFLIRNIYQSVKGNLSVKKFFTGRAQGDEYPTTTFDVYRYYNTTDDTGAPVPSRSERVATKTFTNDEIQKLVGADAGGNGSFKYTFKNLDIYAPDGSYWQYYVVEHAINGYTTTVNVGNVTNADGMTGETTADIESPVLNPENGTPIKAKDTTPDVTFKNDYEEGSGEVKGRKTWEDYNDLFGVRPSVKEFAKTLTFTRKAGDMTEDVKRQTNNEKGQNYFTIKEVENADKTVSYEFSLKNVEQYAPNGIAWTYRVTEKLSDDTLKSYKMTTSTGTVVSTNTGGAMTLTNSLFGQANVEKKWDPAEDKYGLQPDSVTVALQVNLTEHGASTGGENWQDAVTKLSDIRGITGKTAADNAIIAAEIFDEKDLSAGNGWKGSWSDLPTQVKGTNGTLYDIEYRAVETKIGKVEVTPPTGNAAVSGQGNAYGIVSSYQPSQKTKPGETVDDLHVGTTTITNTLVPVSISATKTWSADLGNAWNTRPVTNGNWSVTYLLQRSDDNGASWEWVLKYNTTHKENENLFDEDIVSETITGNGDSNTVTWKDLPARSDAGEAYQYRVVERVPGGYDVLTSNNTGAESLKNADGTDYTETVNGVTYRYYVVSSSATQDKPATQTFTNTLRTVNLQGTKKWNDYGTGLADDLTKDDMPKLTLNRKAGANGAEEPVKYITSEDGKVTSTDAQPEWTKNKDGSFTFTYVDLPAANKNDVPYTYWAVEQGGASDGYYPLYGTNNAAAPSGASGTTTSGDGQTNETITNTATRFTLDKVSEKNNRNLNSIQLAVFGNGTDNKNTVYAVWVRDANGSVNSWVNPAGAAYDSLKVSGSDVIDTAKLAGADFTKMNESATGGTNNRGAIIGLVAGAYRVVETGDAPENHATAKDVAFTLDTDGSITVGDSTVQPAAPDDAPAVAVSMVDPLFRGHVTLKKMANDRTTNPAGAESPLAGAVFSLYHDVNGDGKKDNGDSLVAEGLKTDPNGTWTSWNSFVKIDAKSDIYDATYRDTLGDGLIPGKYYFIETSAPSTVYDPGNWESTPIVFEIKHEDKYHAYASAKPETVPEVDANNALFRAKLTLTKFDAFVNKYLPNDSDGLANVTFKLEYDEAGDGTYESSENLTTGTDGKLAMNIVKKGRYRLTETTPAGYEGKLVATFEIRNEDYNRTYNLNTKAGQTAVNFTEAEGSVTVVTGEGVPNARILGSATLTKTDNSSSEPLNSVTFKLEREVANDKWEQVTSQTFETGKQYALSDDNETATEVTPAQGDPKGKITVSNLWWGTYRFTEVQGLDGYLEGHDNGDVRSNEFTIDARNDAASTNLSVAVTNTPTKLQVQKVDANGDPLKVAGAVFEVKPVKGSSFVDDSKQSLTMATDVNGVAKLEEAQLILGNSYTLQEITAPEGYKKLPDTIEFTVNTGTEQGKPAGSITITKGATGFAADGANGIQLNVQNDPIELQLAKVDANGDAVSSVKFQLTAEGYATTEHTTDTSGNIVINTGLKAGVQYTLTEVSVPGGYTYLDPFTFTFDEYGKISAVTPVDGWSVAGNQLSVTATNEFTDLTIQKYSNETNPADRKPLAGAEFTVTPVEGSAFVGGSPSKTLTTKMNADNTIAFDSLVGQLIVGDSYTIEETKAPAGYTKIDGTMMVTVQEDGSLKIADGTTAPTDFVISSDGTISVFTGDVTNAPTEMTLAKIDASTNAPVTGAQFSLSGAFANGTSVQPLNVTSDDGRIALDKALLIADGTTKYTLTETSAPAGYETLPALEFTVAVNGTITPVNPVAGWSVSDDGITITAADTPVKITLIKNGDDGATNLNGAVFDLYEGDAVTDTSYCTVTTQNGSATFNYLTAGKTYTLIEHTAPAGYELMTEPVTFTVGTDGKIAFTNETAAANAGYAQSHDDGTGVVTITATDHPVEIDLVKNGSDDKSNLDGAEFEVYAGESATGKPVATATTVNGTLSFDKLTANATYTLREKTAPAGYKLMADVVFKVNEYGLVTFADADAAAAAGYSVNEENGVVTITAIDQLIEITLNKEDLGGNPLSGAEFTLTGKFSDTQAESKTLALEGSSYVFSGLIADEEYTLTETKAPEGYELIADGFTFTVNADGTINLADGQKAATDGAEGYRNRIEGDNIAIAAQDTPIEVKLKKQSESGKALAGAVFNVTPADGSSFVNKELNASGVPLVASAANGTVDTAALDAQLIAGNSYVIEEVTPPAGYEKIAGTLTFTVDADGKISAAANVTNDSAFAINTAKDVMTIIASDKPVEVTLNKVGADNAKLDATFTLKGIFASANMDGTVEADESTRTITVQAVQDGVVTLDRLVVDNTYVLQETRSQAGYEVITGTFTFTVNEDGTITPAAEGNDTAYAVADGNIAITATNTPVQITVTKVDEDKNLLEGAEFTLTGDMANANGTVEPNYEWTVKPGADPATIDGLIVTNGKNRHEYTLTETTAPAGYEKLGSITFTINPDGTIAGTGVGYTVDGNGINITAQDTAIKARLMKTDENNQPQAGATFTIEPAAGSVFADGKIDPVEFTTGEGGVIDLTDAWLVGGNTYTITEVTAPNGYELAGTVTFKVNENGTIDLIDADGKPVAAITETDGSGSYLASADNGVAVITATNSPIAVQMVKQSDGTPLAGATFELTPADGFTFADGSTEAQTITIESTSGATALTNLTANMTYILKETVPPAGYELNETEFTFTAAADGTIVSAEADGYTVSGSEIITITVNDEPIEVTLTKQNADGAALDGAEFTLHGMFANADGTPSGTVADRTVVVENGTVALEGLIADQQYTLVETKAPEGYRVNTGTLTFTVNTDGTLTEVKPAESYAIDADTATAITVIDQPTELDLTKLAADGTPLAGAEFTLAPDTERDADSRFVSDRSSIDLVVGEDGTVPTVTGELIAGHAYVLAETKAPDGYALITEPLHFTVGPKGRAATLTAGTELPKGYTIGGNKEAGTIALTAVDNPIELTLKKVNEDGDVLVGAEFTLSGRFADGTTQQILTTGADGTAALPLIIGGERYVLEETKAPEGYVLPAERYTFTVGVDGVIHVQQNPLAALLPGDKTFSLSEDGLTITVVNEREPVVAITGSDVTSVGFIGFGLLLIGATIAMQRRPRMAQVAGNGKPARGRHRR
ncbi:Cna B-type domain-containing protein [Bifidobacterium pullorum subsp. saeculare]|uniref:SpaA isopeptide-forming pilin-related protein n=1 Tax=Bifidobacterium pullorum TaxID=78448 RepID=UPI00195A3EE3|nr:SpaA isopeptide-forming pilin-related protein [Bifidobacterium pullorum]MBM6705574.1 Cna B-type domain-containing protein [Bifidobacterium pullorum subsp. saeculare]